jgi:predicted esterase
MRITQRMKKILKSGQATFNIDVPYKLIETGESSQEKPLIVYLHGFNQNMKQFEKLVTPLLSLNAYHLFVQAPYPIYDRSRKKKVEDWGRSWYLYDGEQDQFVKSLESASDFLEHLIEEVSQNIKVSRLAIFGYSMGGYLAGYFALSRPKLVDELLVVGARIKTEVFEDCVETYDKMNVLALHGTGDKSVKSEPQKKSCKQLSEWGAEVTFKEIDRSHKLDTIYLQEAQKWLQSLDY